MKNTKETLKELNELLTKQRYELSIVRKALRDAPEGKLIIQKRGIYTEYIRIRGSGKSRSRKGIGKNMNLVLDLAHKQYNLELKTRLEANIDAIKQAAAMCSSTDPDTILNSLPEKLRTLGRSELVYGRAYINRNWPNPAREGIAAKQALLKTDKQPQIWAAEPYKENPGYLKQKTHRSAFGVMCRSKSELALLGIYDDFGLFYHSDELLLFGETPMAPDIIGCRTDGTIIYHEHLGLHDEGYRRKSRAKEAIYANYGIIPGKNLIYTYDDENGNLNLKLAREIIKDAYRLR